MRSGLKIMLVVLAVSAPLAALLTFLAFPCAPPFNVFGCKKSESASLAKVEALLDRRERDLATRLSARVDGLTADVAALRLDKAARMVDKSGAKVHVRGFATEVRGREYRRALAYQRAETVAKALRAKGVAASPITISISREYHAAPLTETLGGARRIVGAYIFVGDE